MKLDKSWYEWVVACLRELSDLEFQERVWLRGEGPEVSSYSESVCQLFDDTALGDFLEEGKGQTVISPLADAILLELSVQLDQIDERLSVAEVLSCPAWRKVRELASQSLNLVIQEMDRKG